MTKVGISVPASHRDGYTTLRGMEVKPTLQDLKQGM